MMTFHLHLKKLKKKQDHTRIKFDLEKLKDPDVAQVFKANIGGKFTPLMLLDTDNTGTDTLIDTFNTAVIERPVKFSARNELQRSLGLR